MEKPKELKKINYMMQLNEIKEITDPTSIDCTFIILDFEVSGNNAIVPKEVAMEAAPTLFGKAIVAKYHKVEEPNTNTDAFGGHELILTEDKSGDLIIDTDTVPIGTFTTEGYIMEIGEGDNKKEVLACDAKLWRSRFNDAIDLLLEWYNRGITIFTSCEFLYMNYIVEEGIQTVNSPIFFEGHAILNSESRGTHDIILPAYDESKLLSFNEFNQFQKLVAQAVRNEVENIDEQNLEKEECADMSKQVEMFKKVYEISHEDVRRSLYLVIDETLVEDQYSYVVSVYDSYFIVNIYGNGEDKYFKYTYGKNENDEITVDLESKSEVTMVTNWVEVDVQEMQSQLNSANEKITELETQLNSASIEKSTLETQLNSRDEEIITLKEFKDSIEEERVKKEMAEKLETQKAFYSKKFSALKANEKFESEEVQSLIGKSIGEGEECIQAKFQLNEMLINLVPEEKEKEDQNNSFIKEFASTTEKLIPENDDFDSVFGV